MSNIGPSSSKIYISAVSGKKKKKKEVSLSKEYTYKEF
jgi:hypothetical protein